MATTLLLTHTEIQQGVRALAQQVAEGFPAGEIPMVCVDTAACRFSGELAALLERDHGRDSRITHVRPRDPDPIPTPVLEGYKTSLSTPSSTRAAPSSSWRPSRDCA